MMVIFGFRSSFYAVVNINGVGVDFRAEQCYQTADITRLINWSCGYNTLAFIWNNSVIFSISSVSQR